MGLLIKKIDADKLDGKDSSDYQLIANMIDEDDMVSDSDTKYPTQQSVKTYIDNAVENAGGGYTEFTFRRDDSVDSDNTLSAPSGYYFVSATVSKDGFVKSVSSDFTSITIYSPGGYGNMSVGSLWGK